MPEVPVKKRETEQSLTRRPGLLSRSRWGMSPFSLMRELTDEMDRMFGGANTGQQQLEMWAPTVDVQRCNGKMLVNAELPGLKKEEITVEASADALIIRGERKQEHKEDHEGYHRWERSYGQFYRAIPLPDGAKTEEIRAELKDGILQISIPVPQMEEHKARQIPVAGD